MKTFRDLPKELIDAVCQDYISNTIGVNDIARKYKISFGTMMRIIDERQIPRRGNTSKGNRYKKRRQYNLLTADQQKSLRQTPLILSMMVKTPRPSSQKCHGLTPQLQIRKSSVNVAANTIHATQSSAVPVVNSSEQKRK